MQRVDARCCTARASRLSVTGARAGFGVALIVALTIEAAAAIAGGARPAAEVAATGTRLVMIEEPGCSFCLRWRKEVEPGYVRSDEGRLAPLVHALRDDPAVAGLPRIVYTPTFVLMKDQREIGRIVGYAGADLFWWQIKPLIDSLPAD